MKCVICAKAEITGGQVCPGCGAREVDRLDDIARWHDALAEHLEPGASVAQRVSGSREAPLPLRVDPLDLSLSARQPAVPESYAGQRADQIGLLSAASVLDGWVRDWRDVRAQREHLPVPTVPVLVGWLRVRLDWALVSHPAIDEYSREIRDLHSALRDACEEKAAPPERLWTPCRDCSQLTLARHPGHDFPVKCADCGLSMTEETYTQWSRLYAAAVKEEAA